MAISSAKAGRWEVSITLTKLMRQLGRSQVVYSVQSTTVSFRIPHSGREIGSAQSPTGADPSPALRDQDDTLFAATSLLAYTILGTAIAAPIATSRN